MKISENQKSALVNGLVIAMSAFSGAAGYKKGCELFERAIPQAVNKIHIAGLVADLMNTSDED
jgi:hypothetical protein